MKMTKAYLKQIIKEELEKMQDLSAMPIYKWDNKFFIEADTALGRRLYGPFNNEQEARLHDPKVSGAFKLVSPKSPEEKVITNPKNKIA